jgi:hypothetical protein
MFKLKITGDIPAFKNFINSSTFDRDMRRVISVATKKNVLYLIKEIKQRIRARDYEKNSALTLALNKNSIPLLKEGNLFDAIDHKMITAFKTEVGIIADKNSSSNLSGKTIGLHKLTELMHEGYVIKVTPAMKRAVAIALNEVSGKKRKKLEKSSSDESTGTDVWIVPPRPFLTDVWKDPRVESMLRRNYREAIERVFKMRGAK